MSVAAPCQKCTTFYILFISSLSLSITPSITCLFFHFVCSSIYHQTFEDVGYRRREGGKSQPGLEDEAQNYGSFHFTSDSHTCNILLLTYLQAEAELEAARRSARGGAAMTSVVQEPATATIDEAVASISFLAVALPSTMMPTFFPAAVDGAVL